MFKNKEEPSVHDLALFYNNQQDALRTNSYVPTGLAEKAGTRSQKIWASREIAHTIRTLKSYLEHTILHNERVAPI